MAAVLVRFLYEDYSFDDGDLEKGLFKSKMLVQVSP